MLRQPMVRSMRRYLITAAITATLAPAGAFDAAAASGIVVPKAHALKCAIGTAGATIRVTNTTTRTIPANTTLTVELLQRPGDRSGRRYTMVVRKSMTTFFALEPGRVATFDRVIGEYSLSCSASVRLTPDVVRR